jgi:Zn-dependent M28 family amino/carboxypeptidase
MMAMPGHSFQGALAPTTVDEQALADRMATHVRAIASVEHNTRHPQALAASAKYIETQLADMGYAVALQSYESGDGPVHNIEVEIKGSSKPQEIVVIGAHYDSAIGAPGANDNGSGVATVLELARGFKATQPQRTVRFVLFVNEEPPYFSTDAMGSRVYAERSRRRRDNIVAMLSLETVGYFSDSADSQKYPYVFKPFFPTSGNFIGFVGDLKSRDLVHRSIATFRAADNFPSEAIATFPWIHGIDWSDHAAFWNYNYRALMITDTAPFRYPFYHTAEDTPNRVDYRKMAKVFGGVRAVVADLVGVRS